MGPEFNIYCDESCHLEKDGKKSMVIGAVWCPTNLSYKIFKRIREIKIKHNLNKEFEIKWNKVSPAKIEFYMDILDFFFDDDDLNFRALIVPDKSIIQNNLFNQTQDEFYYKMFFYMLKIIFDPHSSYNIYMDIKDTNSQKKIIKLKKVLRSSQYDFSSKIIKKVQQIRSHEVELMQLTDLLIGAISYFSNGLTSSKVKVDMINRIKERSGYSLKKSTLFKESKFNLFRWNPKQRAQNG